MLKNVAFILIVATFTSCDAATLQQIGSTLGTGILTDGEVGSGLKEALDIGISKGADELSQTDGFFKSPYKILLPPEARKISDRLQNVPGFKNFEATVLEKINRGAEDAAKKAKPIFISAIKQMTFKDALNILMGADDSATQYLKSTTNDKLYTEFNPVIIESLDKFEARTYWEKGVNAYNRIPLVQKANPDLDDYVTQSALNGLFSMVAKEELNIRNNLVARTSDLLRRVFARQDKK